MTDRSHTTHAFEVIRHVSDMTDHELLDALEEVAGASWWQHLWHGPFGQRRAALRDELERRMDARHGKEVVR